MSFQEVNGGARPVKAGANRRYPASSRLSTVQRAFVAVQMVEHLGSSVAAAACICCVNATYVSLVRGMSAADRERLIKGEGPSLSRLANGHRRRPDAKVDAMVIKLGLDRVLAALDRLTKPAAAVPDIPVMTNDASVTNGNHANDNDGVAPWWKEIMAAE